MGMACVTICEQYATGKPIQKEKKKKRLNLFLFPRIKVNIQLQHYTFQIPSWDQNEKRQASYDLTVEKFPGQTVKQEVWIQI